MARLPRELSPKSIPSLAKSDKLFFAHARIHDQPFSYDFDNHYCLVSCHGDVNDTVIITKTKAVYRVHINLVSIGSHCSVFLSVKLPIQEKHVPTLP